MEKYIAYEKLSKKEKRKVDSCRRKTWGNLNPVTRKPTNSKAYNRKKNQYWKDEPHSTDFLFKISNAWTARRCHGLDAQMILCSAKEAAHAYV